jgi:hypothetical protein
MFTFTFSDGSTFFGTYSGTLVPLAPPVFGINGAAIITGGTGLFTTATGSGVASGTNNLATGEFDFVLRGSVTAPGLTPIPEPNCMLLLAGALFGMAGIRSRRHPPCEQNRAKAFGFGAGRPSTLDLPHTVLRCRKSTVCGNSVQVPRRQGRRRAWLWLLPAESLGASPR